MIDKVLTPEQQAKVEGCKTPEEILALVEREGYELSDEELDQISGGASWFEGKSGCPSCGNGDCSPQGMHSYKCNRCGYVFNAS